MRFCVIGEEPTTERRLGVGVTRPGLSIRTALVRHKGEKRRSAILRKPRDKSFVAVTEKLFTILETLSKTGDGQLALAVC